MSDGSIVKDAGGLQPGDALRIKLHVGEITGKVEKAGSL
jgi:hypothetical protein